MGTGCYTSVVENTQPVARVAKALAGMQRRLAAFSAGDRQAVLGDAALTEARHVVQALTGGQLVGAASAEALYCVASLHWLRHQVLPAGEREVEYLAARSLFSRIAAVAPELVPTPLRAVLHLSKPADQPDVLVQQITDALAATTPTAAEIDELLGAARRALNALPAADPYVARPLTVLCRLHCARHLITDDPADLVAAVRDGLRATAVPLVHDEHLVDAWTALGEALITATQRRIGDPAVLAEARNAYRRAVTNAAAAGHAQYPVLAANLATVLMADAFGTDSDVEDLDEAVAILEQAIAAGASGDATLCAGLSSNLAIALQHRFVRTGELDAIDAAVGAIRGSLASASASEPAAVRAQRHGVLAAVLGTRFERTAEASDLEEAIEAARTAVDTDTGPRRGERWNNLGNLLRVRYERRRRLVDLDEAIVVGRAAVEASEGHPRRGSMQANLSSALRERFRLTQDPADLDDAIAVACEGLAEAAASADRAQCQAQLGNALSDRHLVSPSVPDLRDAAAALREAGEQMPPRHHFRGAVLANLGVTLRVLFEIEGHSADLDEAVRVGHDSLDCAGPAHHARGLCLVDLARSLTERHRISGGPEDAAEAERLLREAAGSSSIAPRVRLDALRSLARLQTRAGSDSSKQVAETYRAAVALMPVVAARELHRSDRERLLADCAGLPSEAAAAAIAAGDLCGAVEVLETGRSVIWSQLLQVRTDLSRLVVAAPDLADRFTTVLARTDRPAWAVHQQEPPSADEWETVVGEIRAINGFEHFLDLPDIASMLSAVSDGHAVIVNVADQRCDALVVGAGGIDVVPLPELDVDTAYDRVDVFLRAVQHAEQVGTVTAWCAVDAILDDTLVWLWTSVAEPVLAWLAPERTATARIWWCPTGPLTVLPLHAAHSADRRRWVLDRAVSSSTPTLSILAQARAAPVNADPAGRLLGVYLAETPGQATLSQVGRERDVLRRFGADGHTELEGERATRQDVLYLLATHDMVHFSCHGTQDLRNPTRSGLMLHDGVLTITDMVQGVAAHGELAVLSACRTAVGGAQVLDESLTMAAALHCLGYRRVIGTLWSVGDRRAADVTAGVYRDMCVSGTVDPARSAIALHDAVLELRNRFPRNPTLWAAFVHVGP